MNCMKKKSFTVFWAVVKNPYSKVDSTQTLQCTYVKTIYQF